MNIARLLFPYIAKNLQSGGGIKIIADEDAGPGEHTGMCARGTATLGACLSRPEKPGGRWRDKLAGSQFEQREALPRRGEPQGWGESLPRKGQSRRERVCPGPNSPEDAGGEPRERPIILPGHLKARGCKGRALTRPLRGGGSGAGERRRAYANATFADLRKTANATYLDPNNVKNRPSGDPQTKKNPHRTVGLVATGNKGGTALPRRQAYPVPPALR